MYTPEYTPWENYPKSLYHKEMMNPLIVVTEFFAIDWVTGHKKKLKKWRYYVTHDKIFCDKNHGPGTLLFIYKLNIRLLEAISLLYYSYANSTINKTVVSDLEIEREKEKLDWYPKNLKQKELRNPYKAVKCLFRKMGLQQYRDYLEEWLYAALCVKGGDEELDCREIRKVNKKMLKLYSAAWLIYNREVKKR
ncbi:hypothetical protein [Mucilaginibacter flavus]|uniref:hypothetical protein n=1 Tax=Mucilaginibacter flavus TaxID=931504 RepID=UPI0025B5A52A|nr:hypothetical protein [Mucilaginibacter flavus]MDN3581469.1 hypothetical protein [Mucilaginibacter flavus]